MVLRKVKSVFGGNFGRERKGSLRKVYLASDHGGFRYKKELFAYLLKKGYLVEDLGHNIFDRGDDYVDYVLPLGEKVASYGPKEGARGIVLCRNGQGVCIAANKVPGIRCATGFSLKMIKSTREDDDSNVLAIPSDYVSLSLVKKMVLLWLETPFSGEQRHKRRLKKLGNYETKKKLPRLGKSMVRKASKRKAKKVGKVKKN